MRYFLAILLFYTSLFAHPETTINYRIFFKFSGDKVTDIGESWTFDKTTSSDLLKMYNLNPNATLSKKTSLKVGKEILSGVAEDRYFTYIFKGKKDIGKVKASGFKAQVTKGLVSVAFTNRLPSPIDAYKNTINIQVKDETEGIRTVPLKKSPVILLGTTKKNCKIDVEDISDSLGFQEPSSDAPFLLHNISIKCKKL